MSIIEILFSPMMLVAMLAYGLLTVLIVAVHHFLLGRMETLTSRWLLESIHIPLLQAGAVLLFLLMAYPLLFGLNDGPPVEGLLHQDKRRFGLILGAIFFIGLLAPLLRIPNVAALVLPVQGIVASALLFSWAADSLGLENYSVLPGGLATVSILVLAVTTYSAAAYMAEMLESGSQELFERSGIHTLLSDGLILVMQLPCILVYTLSVGEQLSTA